MPAINNFLSYTSVGLYCPAGDFYIDPRRPVHKALISHAHSDHATPNSGHIYATKATRQMMNLKFRNSIRSVFHEIAFREKFFLNEVAVTFYPSGHMLGSAMILMDYRNEKYLYTGDFKLQADESCEAIEIVKADYLITESTFANPDYCHPDPVKEIIKLNEITQNILIGAYSIGKAQRITQLISRYCPGKKILVHHSISRFHDLYVSNGIDLGNWNRYNRHVFRKEENCIYILPPGWFNRHGASGNACKVFATGWKQASGKHDWILQISDHADWNDLLKMIDLTDPKIVYTLHGDGNILKNYLKDKRDVRILN